jgi:hypothetical protein
LAKILQAESIGEAENCAIELQKIAHTTKLDLTKKN